MSVMARKKSADLAAVAENEKKLLANPDMAELIDSVAEKGNPMASGRGLMQASVASINVVYL